MTREDIVAMARAAEKDERLSDGALYGKLADEIEQLKAALRGLLDEVMCFSIDPSLAALNHAIEEARAALEPKP